MSTEEATTEVEEQEEAIQVDDPPPLRDELRALAARVDSFIESLDKGKGDPLFEKKVELPEPEEIQQTIDSRVKERLEFEVRAREAFRDVFPSDAYTLLRRGPCGRDLCAQVIQHTDSSFELTDADSDNELLKRAELLAAKTRADRVEPKATAIRDYIYGKPPVSTQEQPSALKAHIFGEG